MANYNTHLYKKGANVCFGYANNFDTLMYICSYKFRYKYIENVNVCVNWVQKDDTHTHTVRKEH